MSCSALRPLGISKAGSAGSKSAGLHGVLSRSVLCEAECGLIFGRPARALRGRSPDARARLPTPTEDEHRADPASAHQTHEF